jgi:hypothetical protein
MLKVAYVRWHGTAYHKVWLRNRLSWLLFVITFLRTFIILPGHYNKLLRHRFIRHPHIFISTSQSKSYKLCVDAGSLTALSRTHINTHTHTHTHTHTPHRQTSQARYTFETDIRVAVAHHPFNHNSVYVSHLLCRLSLRTSATESKIHCTPSLWLPKLAWKKNEKTISF